MTTMPVWWFDNVLDVLQVLSDVDYQRRAWFEASIPGVCDDPTEFLCRFFDDSVSVEALAKAEGRVPEAWLRSLRALHSELDYYGGRAGPPIELGTLQSERWLRITRMAAVLRRETELLHPRRAWRESVNRVLMRISQGAPDSAEDYRHVTGTLLHLASDERVEQAERALPESWLAALRTLRDEVREYRKRNPRGDRALDDPSWQRIMTMAATLLTVGRTI